MDVEVVEATVGLGGWVLATVVGLTGVVTTEVWGAAAGVVPIVVGGSGVEDGAGCGEGDGEGWGWGGVLLCTVLEEGGGGEGGGGVEEGGAEEGEGWTTLDGGVVLGAIENEKKTWSVTV